MGGEIEGVVAVEDAPIGGKSFVEKPVEEDVGVDGLRSARRNEQHSPGEVDPAAECSIAPLEPEESLA